MAAPRLEVGCMEGITGAVNTMLYLLGGLAFLIVAGVAVWFGAVSRGRMRGE